MANAYSFLNNYDAPLYSPDFQSISKALTYKQNKLDTNRAALDQMYDQLTDLDILKGQDKDYANKRIASVTKLVNQYANQDLSNDGLAKSLQIDLNQVLDDNVKNAVYSTAVFRAEEKQWDKLKSDNPDKYADQNYWYAHKGFNNYMNDGKVGSKYSGGGGIIEFQDVASKINKSLPQMMKDRGVNVQINEFGEYYWDKTKTKDISEAEVMSAIQASLNDKDKQQLQISANFSFKDHSDSDIFNMYNNNKEAKIKNVNSEIQKLNKALTSSLPSAYKDVYTAQKNQLENYKKSLSTGSMPSRRLIENSLYNEDFFSPFRETYSTHQVLEKSLIKDEVSLKQLDFEIDLAKMSKKHDYAKEMLALENLTTKKKNIALSSKIIGAGTVTELGVAIPEQTVEIETPLGTTQVKPHYSQIQDETDGLLRNLTEQGVLPDMFTKSQNRDQAMQIISNFNGVSIGKSADGKKDVYVIGFENGNRKTMELTTEQAENMQNLGRSMKVLSDTENRMIGELDDGIEKFKNDLITADDVASGNLLGFRYRVKNLSNGEKTLVPVKDQATFQFAQLVKKAKRDPESLSADEKDTLDLYVGLDVVGSLTEEEDNLESSVVVDASQAWLQRKSLEYNNGGQFISHSPNDYNVYQDNPIQQTSVSKEGLDNVDLRAISSEEQRQAYMKVMDEFYDGQLVVIKDPVTRGVRVDNNIVKLVNRMIGSGKDIGTYNFSDSDKEFIFNANTNGVGRVYWDDWGTVSYPDATAYDLDRGDLERDDPDSVFDENASVVSFSKFHSNISSTLNSISDDLSSQHKLPQQKGLLYSKDTDAGELVMSDIEQYFFINENKNVEMGDKIFTSYTLDGDVAVFGDIALEGEEVEFVTQENPFIIKRDKIPPSIPRQDIQETTLFNVASKSPDSRYIHVEALSQVPSIVDFTLNNVEEGTIDREDYEQFVNNLAADGMVFSIEPDVNSYVSVLKIPYQGSDKKGVTSHTSILLDDTGLPSLQEKGTGSIQEIMTIGSDFDNIINLYGEQVVVGILNAYLQDVATRTTNP